jgi:hypothetical protein
VVKNEELGRRLIGEGFAHLLYDPTARGVPGDIEVHMRRRSWRMMKKQ